MLVTPRDTARFWSFVAIPPGDSCWVWTGSRNKKGYGRFRLGARLVAAHRLAWQIRSRTDPGALMVCHACDTPSCVRPGHLFLGTALDNTRDCIAKGRARRGKARPGQRHHAAKLTDEQVAEIRARAAAGESKRSIARSFGVWDSAIVRICNGSRWGHIARDESAMARGTRRARLNLGLASRRVAASQINEIRERVRAGASQRSLAAAYGLSKSTIGNIVHGREWYGEAV